MARCDSFFFAGLLPSNRTFDQWWETQSNNSSLQLGFSWRRWLRKLWFLVKLSVLYANWLRLHCSHYNHRTVLKRRLLKVRHVLTKPPQSTVTCQFIYFWRSEEKRSVRGQINLEIDILLIDFLSDPEIKWSNVDADDPNRNKQKKQTDRSTRLVASARVQIWWYF